MSAFSSPPCPSSVTSVLCTSCPGDTKTSTFTNDVFPGRPNAYSTVNARPFSEDVGKKEKAIFALIVPSYGPIWKQRGPFKAYCLFTRPLQAIIAPYSGRNRNIFG